MGRMTPFVDLKREMEYAETLRLICWRLNDISLEQINDYNLRRKVRSLQKKYVEAAQRARDL